MGSLVRPNSWTGAVKPRILQGLGRRIWRTSFNVRGRGGKSVSRERRSPAIFALLVAAIVVVLIAGAAMGYSLWRRSHPFPSATAQHYVRTPWGTRCQVGADQIICDTCEPGLLVDTPSGAQCPTPSFNEIAVDAAGAQQKPHQGLILPESPIVQQLVVGQTYDIGGWTITVGGWVRFTNDSSRHGMAVAAQNEQFF
jgi:hypothetical protein